MNLGKLMEMQKVGALKVHENSNEYQAIIGGQPMSAEQCAVIARHLGWEGRTADKPYKMIEKVDRFVRNMRLYIDNPYVISQTNLMFESMRKTDSLKISDRIKFVSPDYDLTIIHGTPGLGGSYAVFDVDVSHTKPVFACRTLKALGEYLNQVVE